MLMRDYSKLPKSVRNGVFLAEQRGHDLVSLGCAQFRCVKCNERGFCDDGGRLGGDFGKTCKPKVVTNA
jgi:hypothetical protein